MTETTEDANEKKKRSETTRQTVLRGRGWTAERREGVD